MAAEWAEVQAKIDALAMHDKKRVAEGAAEHDFQFDASGDVEAWLAEHGAWLDREIRVFATIEEMFSLCPTMEEFRTGFLVREPELPFALRLCSFWNVAPPPQYKFDESDPEPGTVQFRWFEEQYKRQRTRQRFQGGLGGVMKMLPSTRKPRKG